MCNGQPLANVAQEQDDVSAANGEDSRSSIDIGSASSTEALLDGHRDTQLREHLCIPRQTPHANTFLVNLEQSSGSKIIIPER